MKWLAKTRFGTHLGRQWLPRPQYEHTYCIRVDYPTACEIGGIPHGLLILRLSLGDKVQLRNYTLLILPSPHTCQRAGEYPPPRHWCNHFFQSQERRSPSISNKKEKNKGKPIVHSALQPWLCLSVPPFFEPRQCWSSPACLRSFLNGWSRGWTFVTGYWPSHPGPDMMFWDRQLATSSRCPSSLKVLGLFRWDVGLYKWGRFPGVFFSSSKPIHSNILSQLKASLFFLFPTSHTPIFQNVLYSSPHPFLGPLRCRITSLQPHAWEQVPGPLAHRVWPWPLRHWRVPERDQLRWTKPWIGPSRSCPHQ